MDNVKEFENTKFYTLKELEGIIGVTRVTLLNYVKAGKLPAVKICSKWRVKEEDLRNFLEGR